MSRKYRIWESKNADTGEVTLLWVTDITDEEQKREKKTGRSIRPEVARFPISQLYPLEEQQRRATMLRDYLNKIQEAKERAERDTAFVDLITAGTKI